jgi:hypothetical protein
VRSAAAHVSEYAKVVKALVSHHRHAGDRRAQRPETADALDGLHGQKPASAMAWVSHSHR